jgi:hypothetical protein
MTMSTRHGLMILRGTSMTWAAPRVKVNGPHWASKQWVERLKEAVEAAAHQSVEIGRGSARSGRFALKQGSALEEASWFAGFVDRQL